MENFDYKKYLSNNPLTEAYVPGEGWIEDFEYDDMLAHGLTLTTDTPLEDLQKVVDDFEDVNYHREAAHLFDAIDAIKAGDRGEAKMYINKFHKEIKTTLAGFDDVNDDYTIDENKENKETKNTKMKKSELKEMIKAAMMAEGPIKEDEATAVVDTDDPKSPILNKLLKKHKVTMVAAPGFGKFKLTGPLKGLKAVLQDEEGWGINDLHNYIKEAKEEVDVEDNEEVDVDIEKDVEIDDESVESDIEVDASMPGESDDEVAVQSLLMKAQEEAAKLGDEKLTDQIGNTITYFTRAHVATVDEDVNEETDYDNSDAVSGDINVTNDNPAADAEIGLALNEEVSRFKKLAGIIK